MRFYEFKTTLVEKTTLSSNEIKKYPRRMDTFINKVRSGDPFTDLDGNPFVIRNNPEDIQNIEAWLTADPKTPEGDQVIIYNQETNQEYVIKATVSPLRKTKKDFGGVDIAYDETPDDITTFDKNTAKLTPTDVFGPEQMNLSGIWTAIERSNELQSTEYGKIVIELARQIKDGKIPNISDTPEVYIKAIQQFGGEYLGVMALLNGTAKFPNEKEFFKHLGRAGNPANKDELVVSFPESVSAPIGDSIGRIGSRATDFDIFISSKAGKQGAPASLKGLKIPDEFRKKEDYKNVIAFIDIAQAGNTANQPFEMYNKIGQDINAGIVKKEVFPNGVGEISNEDIQVVLDTLKTAPPGTDITSLPESVQRVINAAERDGIVNPKLFKVATPPGIAHYTFAKLVIRAVNDMGAYPEFEPMAREILQQNFIQIHAWTTKPKGKLTFHVLWPNREIGTGSINLWSKSSTNGRSLKQMMSFSVKAN